MGCAIVPTATVGTGAVIDTPSSSSSSHFRLPSLSFSTNASLYGLPG